VAELEASERRCPGGRGGVEAEGGREPRDHGKWRVDRALLPGQLIDEFLLMVHPLLFGSGRRLFGEVGPPTNLNLVEIKATDDGVLVLSYRQ
jgi:hypothetical protein